MTGGYLVYVRGLHGPELQKWPELTVLPNGSVRDHLKAVPVSATVYALPLRDLEKFYPAPEIKAE